MLIWIHCTLLNIKSIPRIYSRPDEKPSAWCQSSRQPLSTAGIDSVSRRAISPSPRESHKILTKCPVIRAPRRSFTLCVCVCLLLCHQYEQWTKGIKGLIAYHLYQSCGPLLRASPNPCRSWPVDCSPSHSSPSQSHSILHRERSNISDLDSSNDIDSL